MSTGDYPYTNIYTAGAGLMVSSGASWQTLELNLPDNKDFKEVQSRLDAIESRLAILRPNEELQARFPALQEAYEHYKLIEKLVNDQK
jgi:hypothetical protein